MRRLVEIHGRLPAFVMIMEVRVLDEILPSGGYSDVRTGTFEGYPVVVKTMRVGKQDDILKIRKVSIHDHPGCLKYGFNHLSQRLYPHPVLSLLVCDTLYYAGAIHVAHSMGRHPPDTKPTSEDISCLVSETSLFSSRFLTLSGLRCSE